ncbi:hypothetical protein BDN71DRAFT_1513936 [Pleurotus eryngii]|uniref:Ubiquitin-like protease family profile domain-containing protein n=1 Tax=Pleurotus eryngii TaxID=5323 RepID=A0A9P6D985_PLEER|nr:hypothetical protein BDN71DRAFT_1513936 [Pleurotus eryngii]
MEFEYTVIEEEDTRRSEQNQFVTCFQLPQTPTSAHNQNGEHLNFKATYSVIVAPLRACHTTHLSMPKSQRKSQIVVPGLGQHYVSSKKVAPRHPTIVRPLGHELKKRRLTDELNKLLANSGTTITAVPDTPTGEHDDRAHNTSDVLDDLAARMITNMDMDPPTPRVAVTPPPKAIGKASNKLYSSWASLLPTLVEPLLDILRKCTSGHDIDCKFKTFNMLCLFPDHFRMMEVQGCKCQTIPQRLVTHGLFPTSSAQPRIAVSIDLLNFFHSLFEESCDAVHAISHALKKYYLRCSYILTSNQTGDEVKKPFRQSLRYAMQWHDTLRLLVDKRVQAAVNAMVHEAQKSAISTAVEPHDTSSPPDISSGLPNTVLANHGINHPPSLPIARCARKLQSQCPACFGGDKFGVPFSEGGDFHIAVDGNFHHRHRHSAGDSARFHKPEYFLSKEEVDRVGVHIHKARKGKPKEIRPVVPNEAIDQCKQSHDAANDNKAKSNVEQFDDHGISALVCRHGAPLFTTNIDTPGEQQKLRLELINGYDILPPDITARLEFAMSAMHMYAHQWSCQLVYNPRLREGVRLTDGEGLERLWSRLRKLIGITCTSGRSRRIWLVDRQLNSIGSSHCEDLGDWLTRRYAFAQKESGLNKTVVRNTGFTVKELQHEWALQREAQLSVQAHAPMRLKQELDSILNLQSELDSLDMTIEATKKALSKGTTPLASRLLPELTLTGEKLRTQANQIYDTLNVQNHFPELKQCSLEFVCILLILRDLKINIRKCVIGSFFEWDKLDQAAMQKIDRCTEESVQLHRKAENMCLWLTAESAAVRQALAVPRNKNLLLRLKQYLTSVERLEARWTCSLITRKHLRGILDQSRSNPMPLKPGLTSTPSNQATFATSVDCSMEVDYLNDNHEVLAKEAHFLEPEAIILSDILEDTEVSDDGLEVEVMPIEALVSLCHSEHTRTPRADQDKDVRSLDSDLTDGRHIALNKAGESTISGRLASIHWALPDDMCADYNTLLLLRSVNYLCDQVPNNSAPHMVGRYSMYSDSIRLLFSPQSWLDDIRINACASLLQDFLSAPQLPSSDISRVCAIFSTHDLVRVRHNASDEYFWGQVRAMEYWNKATWIIPIHRPSPENHWILCIALPHSHILYLFDSFGHRRSWDQDVEDVMKLVTRLVLMANKQYKSCRVVTEGWTAKPTCVQAMQTNGYDCGVWVLAEIAAALQGFHVPALTELESMSLGLVDEI